MKFFAYYLPQFHPTPENDLWWGKGFTEWTNVTKAKKLFPGHQQPKLPTDLGFYDLRVPQVMEEQAKMAKEYGVDGFVFYHYWFGNDRVMLEKPIQQFLQNPKVDIQFCMCWANESWKGTWHGASKNQLLQEQKYLGVNEYIAHFEFLLPFFLDSRCLRIADMPVYQIYVPEAIPDLNVYVDTFNRLAITNGLKGIYWIGVKSSNDFNAVSFGIQGMVNGNLKNINRYHSKTLNGLINRYLFSNPLIRKVAKWPKRIPYRVVRYCLEEFKSEYDFDFYPLAIPNWDNTPRVKHEGTVYVGTSPKAFKEHLSTCLVQAQNITDSEKQIIFIKSWNEWAEGNILEPESEFGLGYLEAIKEVVNG